MHNPNVGLQLCSQFSEFVQPGPEQTRSVLSYNAPQFRDYLPAHLFLNLAKQLRTWRPVLSNNFTSHDESLQDADGYYTAIPADTDWVGSIWAWGIFPDAVLGNYTWTYEGEGTLTITGNVSNVVQNPNAGGNGGTVTFTVTGKGNISFRITAMPDPVNYPRNFVITPNSTDWATRLAAGEVFTPDYIDHLMPNGQPLAEYRHLNSMIINNSTVIEFDELPQVSSAVYTDGIPLAVLCQLARETGHAPWFCIPAQASDQFVLDMAAFVAQELPDVLDEIRIEYTNEAWNPVFMQCSQMQFEAARDFGGIAQGITTITQGTNTFTVADASGIQATQQVQFYNPDRRNYSSRYVNEVNGNEVTVSFNFSSAEAGANVEVTSSSFYDTTSAYSRRASQVMALWEQGAGVRPVRIAGAFLAGASIASEVLNGHRWRTSGASNFSDPVGSFDAVAVSTYIYGLNATALEGAFLTAYRSSYEEGRDLALDALLGEGKGLDVLAGRLSANRSVADLNGLNMVCYEGFSDHSIQGDLSGNDVQEIVDAYESILYSTDYAPVWERHLDIQRRYLDGPAMIYVDIAAPSRFGLFGLRRELPDTSGRTTSILGLANTQARWWGHDVPPQKAGDWEDVITRTTNEKTSIDYRKRFTSNAATFSAIGLPDGVTMESNGVLIFEPTTPVDLNVVAQIIATTSQGVAAAYDQVFDITYVPPIVIPPPDYITTFADGDTGVSLRNGATLQGGELICEQTAQQSHGRLEAFELAAAAADPDSYTYSFTYRLDDGYFIGFAPNLADGSFRVKGAGFQVSVRRNSDGVERQVDVPTSQNIIGDGSYHRLTFYVNILNQSGKIWQDGVEIASFDSDDISADVTISRLNPKLQIPLGAEFAGVVLARFSDFQAWFDTELTPEQIVALGT